MTEDEFLRFQAIAEPIAEQVLGTRILLEQRFSHDLGMLGASLGIRYWCSVDFSCLEIAASNADQQRELVLARLENAAHSLRSYAEDVIEEIRRFHDGK